MFGFTGSFEHNLDSKNRLFVPAKFRERLGDSFVIRVKPSRHPHIECFTEEEFEKRVERELSRASDEYTREKLLFASRSNANVVTVDSQGRISVNATILKYSGLEKTGLFVGMGDHVQIWNPEKYDEYFMQINDEIAKDEEASLKEAEKRREFKADGRFIELKN